MSVAETVTPEFEIVIWFVPACVCKYVEPELEPAPGLIMIDPPAPELL